MPADPYEISPQGHLVTYVLNLPELLQYLALKGFIYYDDRDTVVQVDPACQQVQVTVAPREWKNEPALIPPRCYVRLLPPC